MLEVGTRIENARKRQSPRISRLMGAVCDALVAEGVTLSDEDGEFVLRYFADFSLLKQLSNKLGGGIGAS